MDTIDRETLIKMIGVNHPMGSFILAAFDALREERDELIDSYKRVCKRLALADALAEAVREHGGFHAGTCRSVHGDGECDCGLGEVEKALKTYTNNGESVLGVDAKD